MISRGRTLVFLSGLACLATLGVAAWAFLRPPARPTRLQAVPEDEILASDFERLADNAQGYPEYRHRRTGIVLVRLPGGAAEIGVDPEYRRQFVEEYSRHQTMLMSRKKPGPVFPDDDAELSPAERTKREERRRLARGWLAHLQHEVTLTPFLIAKYEVTQEQWTAVMGTNPSKFKIQGAERPVEGVSWQDCREFCDKVGLALPSEAQWEYACRAGSEETIAGTGRIDDMAWYQRNSDERTHPVGQKAANDFGLYDVHGNVWEWCEDVEDWEFYEKAESRGVNPVCRSGSEFRIVRGGSYKYGAFHCRASQRARGDPSGAKHFTVGLRPVFVP